MHALAYGLAAALYLAAAIRYTVSFARARPGTPRVAAVLVFAGLLVHATGVALYGLRFGEPPLVGLGPSLTTLALLIGMALVGLELFSNTRAVGLILAPVAAALVFGGLLTGLRPATEEPLYREPWLIFHVSLSFLGYVAWMVAASAAAMYLLQFRELKHKRLGAIFRFFPPLDALDRLSERALLTGFSALTLGILLGWAWAVRFEVLRWSDPKIVWGGLSWVVLLLVVWARLGPERTSRKAAVWNVTGFGLVFAAYLVAKLAAPEARFFL